MRNLRICAFLAAAFLLALAGPVSQSRAEEDKIVTLLYTGDFKGQVFPRQR